MPLKRSNDGKSSTSLQKAGVRKASRQLDEGKRKKQKTSAHPVEQGDRTKRACSKRVRTKRQNKMAATLDSDEKDSDLSSDDERGFFQMAESDEDTEDASETDMAKLEEEFSELKEQVYQEKLSKYKKQLQELNNVVPKIALKGLEKTLNAGTQADYLKRLNQLEKERDDRLFLAEVCKVYEIEMLNKECEDEKKAAKIEFENKKVELKETLLQQLEDKKKSLELEKLSMELTNDILESKPAVTRKLRRRPNDPPPAPEKRRKNSPVQICLLLDDIEVVEDLKAMNKLHSITSEKNGSKVNKSSNNSNQNSNQNNQVADALVSHYEIRVEDGKLFYDRRWYHRGQQVYVESKESGKISGIIHAIGPSEICVKKTSDNSKLRITINQLQKGRYTIRRRSS